MKKGKKVKQLSLYPCKNVFLEDGEKEKLAKYLNKIYERPFEDSTAKEEYIKTINDILFKLENDDGGYNLDYLMPLITNKSLIFDYIEDCVVVIDECKMVFFFFSNFSKEFSARAKDLLKRGSCLSENGNFQEFSKVVDKIADGRAVVFQKLTNTNKFFQPQIILEELEYLHILLV